MFPQLGRATGKAGVSRSSTEAVEIRRGRRTNRGLSGVVKRLPGMAMNFLACDREQAFLMPPDPRDWLPEDHLAWFVLASVEEMDLGAFYGSYRQDGWGRAAFEPSMMVALLLYAYAQGERSSRGIERRCVEDVAYRVIAAQQTPDHATIARFRVRHEAALAHLFGEVLGSVGSRAS
jgi:transposase